MHGQKRHSTDIKNHIYSRKMSLSSVSQQTQNLAGCEFLQNTAKPLILEFKSIWYNPVIQTFKFPVTI